MSHEAYHDKLADAQKRAEEWCEEYRKARDALIKAADIADEFTPSAVATQIRDDIRKLIAELAAE